MPYIKNDEIRIYYEVLGKGQPVVFHHGNGNSVADWHDLGYVNALQDKYQLILFDARGYGKSDKPHNPKAYTVENRISDTIAVLDHLNIKQAYCFGYSMGGRFAFALMKYYPERFKGFIVGGMNPYGGSDARDFFKEWLIKGMPYVVQQIEKIFGPFPGNIRNRYLQNDTQAMLLASSCVWPDTSDVLTKITVPCLLYGAENDSLISELKLEKNLSSYCELRILKNVNHCQAFWDSKISVQLINDFFENLDKPIT